jgi:membrane protein DedA with SNARE-associated domain
MHLGLILGVAVIACLVSDLGWYAVGRRRGIRVLQFLCRISLEPDSCVRQTEDLFSRRGRAALIVAKFVPGLSTVAPPLAGITGMPVWRFILFDGVGALLWTGVFALLGALFSEQLEGLALLLATMGSWLLAILLGGLGAYLLWKFVARRRFLRRLRVARITPDELHQKLEAGEEVLIVDLRHALEFDGDPLVIPGAIRFSAQDLEAPRLPLPPDREVVLYCS